MKGIKIMFALLIMVLMGVIIFYPEAKVSSVDLKKFSSYEEMKDFIKTNTQRSDFGLFEQKVMMTGVVSQFAESAGASDYSTTNIQVEGVDEADIVKNDGKYIYVVSGNKVFIVDAYPAENAKILSEMAMRGTPQEIFINKNKLIIFGQEYDNYILESEAATSSAKMSAEFIPRRYSSNTFIEVYDISDREAPVLKRNISLEGNYFNSRMIGDYVYAIINQPAYYTDDRIPLPMITEGSKTRQIQPEEIYYFDIPDYSYNFANIVSINTQDDDEKTGDEVFLMGSAQNMYVSLNNIYITYAKGGYYPIRILANIMPEDSGTEKTVIHKISVKDGIIKYKAQGEVPGHILNQFSMDEYNDYFRIATTVGRVSRSAEASSENNVYVLDEDLEIVGSLEDLAPGEQIYSARFMGERAYLVTFKKIDPLFVIDLKDPKNPSVLGKLKIPGYSDYLHPYDEDHIIGIGKEAAEAEEGNFAWYQGVKMAIFDVSDVENPKELHKVVIGDRGTDSPVLYDHKAFLFDKKKNLLVIPITLAEIKGEKTRDNQYGEFTFQGAYVYDISLEKGFDLKGRVTHYEDDDAFMKSGYYFRGDRSIQRSLYIGDVLYTLSSAMLQMNDLSDLERLNAIDFN
ncbi:MAG: beta-propeller domain-containing protein [Candidatus Woesearchaeota archaeon]|nr:beta-propeller domain-containing protein [Candidatus Woesearchaeota archaeon]